MKCLRHLFFKKMHPTYLFCARTVIVKNVVPLFSIYFLFEKMKLVISNHFNIVRLKTQSEKYMALKDKISSWGFDVWKSFRVVRKKVFLEASCRFVICHKGFKLSHLWFSCQDNKKQLKSKRIVLKRVSSQRFDESCGFSPGTPVSSRKKYCRVVWILKYD